jgi:hypothetical protein
MKEFPKSFMVPRLSVHGGKLFRMLVPISVLKYQKQFRQYFFEGLSFLLVVQIMK